MSDPIRFGDIVYIQFDLKGESIVLSGEGFFGSNLWAGSPKTLASASFRSCLFQIYPMRIEGVDPFAEMYDKKLKNYSEIYSKNPEIIDKFKSEIDFQKDQEKNLISSVKLFNQREIEVSKGFPLTYNSKFYLRHLDSGLFLEMRPHSEPLSPHHLTAKLTKNVSLLHYLVFRPVVTEEATPDYTDIVTYAANFYIFNPHHKLALTYNPVPFEKQPLKITNSEYLDGYRGQLPPTIAHRLPADQENQATYLICGGNMDENSKVTLTRFNVEIPEENSDKTTENLRVGDYFRFNARGKYLSVRFFGEDKKMNQFRFEESTDPLANTVNHVFSIFQVIKVSDIEKSELPLQQEIPSFEMKEKKTLYPVEHPKFYLKHLITGKIFVIKKGHNGILQPALLSISEIGSDLGIYPYVEFVKSDAADEEVVQLKNYYLIRLKNMVDNEVYFEIGGQVHDQEPSLKSEFYTGLMHSEKQFDKKKWRQREWELKFVKNYKDTGYLSRCELLGEEEVHYILETQNLFFKFTELFNFMEEFKNKSGRVAIKRGVSMEMKRASFFGTSVDPAAATTVTDTLKQLSSQISNLQCYLEEYINSMGERAQTQNNIELSKRRILRELKVLGGAATMLLVLITDNKFVEKIQSEINEHKVSKEDFSPMKYVNLFMKVNKFIRESTKGSPQNKLVLSQFINVFAHCFLIDTGAALQLIDDEEAVLKLKRQVCETAQDFLSEVNREALEQFQNNTDLLIDLLLKEKDYGGLILSLMQHLLGFKSDVNSLLREKLTPVLIDDRNLRHIFPMFFEENGEIKVRFERLADRSKSRTVLIEEFANPDTLSKESKELYEYLDLSLKTAIALAAFESTQIFITFIKHFPIKILLKLINGERPCSRETKNRLLEITYKIHFQYFRPPVDSLPTTIRINVADPATKEQLEEQLTVLKTFLEQSPDKIISEYEWDYIKSLRIETQIRETQDEYRNWRKTGFSSKAVQDGQLESLEDIVQILKEYLLTQGEGNVGKEAVVAMYAKYQKALELACTGKLGSISSTALTSALKLFEKIQDKRVKYTADAILTGIEQKLIREITSERDVELIVQGESEKENLLMEKKKTKDDEHEHFDPMSVVRKFIPKEKELEGTKSYEDPRWAELKKDHEILEEIDKSRRETKADEIIDNFIRIIPLNLNKDTQKEAIKTDYAREAIKNLRIAANFEQSLYEELTKTEFITDVNEMRKTVEIFRTGTDIYKIVRLFRNEHLSKVRGSSEFDAVLTNKVAEKMLKELNAKLDLLIITIYDTNVHFKDSSPNAGTAERFISALRASKDSEDLPFKSNHSGIRRNYQEIFNVLKIQEIVVGLIEMLYEQINRFKSLTKPLILILRKCYITLSLFCVENALNKQSLYTNEVLKRIFEKYGKRFISESIDAFMMVNELLAGNDRLAEFDNAPLMSLLESTFVTPLSAGADIPFESMSWNDYICTSSLRFLSEADLPKTLAYFDIADTLRNYFTSLGRYLTTGNLKDLSLTKLTEEQGVSVVKLTPTYYSIKELLECWGWLVPALEKRKNNVELLFTNLTVKNWIQILKRPELLFQFEIRKLLCQTFCKVYEHVNIKQKVIEESAELRDLMFILLDDMRAFIEFSKVQYQLDPSKASQRESESAFDLKQLGRFGFDPSLNSVRDAWKTFYGKRLDTLSFNIYLEVASIKELWNDYIYNGCCKLLELLLTQETDLMTKTLIDKSYPPTLFQHYMLFCEKLLECPVKSLDKSAYARMENTFGVLLMKRDYAPYKQELERFENLVRGQGKVIFNPFQTLVTKQTFSQEFDSRLQTPEKTIKNLMGNSEKIYEMNIEKISKIIHRTDKGTASPEKGKDVLKVLMQFMRTQFTSLDTRDLVMIFKLLRAPIEEEIHHIELSNIQNSSQEPTRRRIAQYQNILKELRLTNAIIRISIRLNDEEILKELMHLSLAYLYGGNREVQKEFYDALVKDSENTLLLKLSNLLERKFDTFIENETSRIQALYQTSLKLRFEYLEGQEKEPKDEKELQQMFTHIQTQFRSELKIQADREPQNELLLAILKFLQALCENQFTDLQNFLREQKAGDDDDVKTFKNSFNFLDLLTTFFGYYHRVHSAYNLEVGKQIISVIIEMIQGDVDKNIQTVVERSLYLDATRMLTDYNSTLHLLPRGYNPFPYRKIQDVMLAQEMKSEAQKKKINENALAVEKALLELQSSNNFMNLKSKCLELLVTIAQYPSETCVQTLQKYIDTERLLEEFENIMYEVFNWRKGLLISEKGVRKDINAKLGKIRNEELHGVLGDAISIYILFKYLWKDEWESHLRDTINNSSRKYTELKALEICLFQFMPNLAGSVEIVVEVAREGEDLIRYWFPVIPECRYFRSDLKEKLLSKIDRTTPETKIDSIMENVDDVRAEMQDEYNIQVLKKVRSTRGMFLFILGLNFCVALIVNYLNLTTIYEGQTVLNYWTVVYNMIFKFELPSGYTGASLVYMLISVVCVYLNFIFAITNIILWLSTQWPRQQRITWRNKNKEFRDKIGDFPLSIQRKLDAEEYDKLERAELKMILLYKGPESEEFKVIRSNPRLYKQIRGMYWRHSIGALIVRWEFIWLIIYSIISFQAISCSAKWSMFLLADIAVRSDALKRLLGAVRKNLHQFLWTLFLLIFIALVYTYIAFYGYPTRMISNNRDLCTDYLECFLNVLNLGLRSGGGLSDNLEALTYDSSNKTSYVLGVIFDLSFYFIVIAIFLNLIFGMIVDAFGDLRDQKFDEEKDQLNSCVICSLERQDFRGIPFDEQHRGREHNLWNYINFIIYIKNKEEHNRNEMNGIENYVARKLSSQENDWVPQLRSLTLEKLEAHRKRMVEDEEEKIAENVDATLDEIKTFKKSMTSLVIELRKSIQQAEHATAAAKKSS